MYILDKSRRGGLIWLKTVCSIAIVLLLGTAVVKPAAPELTKAQAIARVRTILNSNTSRCRINKVNSVTAASVRAGWRVTAQIIMSASGSRSSETASWIVSAGKGAVAQSQLASEIANGCP